MLIHLSVISDHLKTNENDEERTDQCCKQCDLDPLAVLFPFFLRLDNLVTEFEAPVDIDGISTSLLEVVNQAAASVSKLYQHDVENMVTDTKHLEHLVFIKMRGGVAALIGVTDKGL